MYASAFSALICIGLVALLRMTFGSALYSERRLGYRAEIQPSDRHIGKILGIFWLAVIMIVSLVPLLMKTRSELVLDKSFLAETGCKALAAFEYRWDRNSLKTKYVYQKTRGKGGKRHKDRLKIQSSDGGLSTYVNLTAVRQYPALIDLAPDAMRQYAENLVATGRAVDDDLKALLQQPRNR